MSHHAPGASRAAVATGVGAVGIVPANGLSYMPADRRKPILNRSIGDALRAAADAWGERTALVEGCIGAAPRRRWSYRALLLGAEQVASALLDRFSSGEHVAICAANSADWVLAEFGAALAGLVLVTANPALLGQELLHLLRQSKASGILVQSEYRGRDLLAAIEAIRRDLPALREVIPLADWPALVASAPRGARLPPVSAGDVAQIQYTSGTTGLPKGALLTHRGLVNNARFYARAIGTGTDNVWINPMPLFHTAGAALQRSAPCRPVASMCSPLAPSPPLCSSSSRRSAAPTCCACRPCCCVCSTTRMRHRTISPPGGSAGRATDRPRYGRRVQLMAGTSSTGLAHRLTA